MELHFNTQQVVDVDEKIAFENAKLFLMENDYNIINASANLIKFNDELIKWKWVSNFKYYGKVSSGLLKFIGNNQQTNISLNYCISITFELFQLAAIILASICISYEALFLILVITLNFAFKVYYIRNNFIRNMINLPTLSS